MRHACGFSPGTFWSGPGAFNAVDCVWKPIFYTRKTSKTRDGFLLSNVMIESNSVFLKAKSGGLPAVGNEKKILISFGNITRKNLTRYQPEKFDPSVASTNPDDCHATRFRLSADARPWDPN